MSTRTPPRHVAPAPPFVPSPRRPADPPVSDGPERPRQYQTWDGGEPSRVFGQHRWVIAACGIACVIALFTAMILLTWAAGGTTPFNR